MIVAASILAGWNANAVEKQIVKPFEGVSVNVPARVRFVYGEDYKVYVHAQDSLFASGIRYGVQDGVLKIRSIDELDQNNELFITITTPIELRLMVGRDVEVKRVKRADALVRKD